MSIVQDAPSSTTDAMEQFTETAHPPARPTFKRLTDWIFRDDAMSAALISALVIMGGVVGVVGANYLQDKLFTNKGGAAIVEQAEGYGDGDEEGAFGDDPVASDNAVNEGDLPVTAQDNVEVDAANVVPDMDNISVDDLSADLDPTSAPANAITSGGTGAGGGAGGLGEKGTGTGKGGRKRPEERWQIKYENTQSLEAYAKQLDFFHVELGVMRGPRLEIISQLSTNKPSRRPSSGTDNRLFFRWHDAGRRKADLELAKKAGITGENLIIVHYIDNTLETTLKNLESDYAKSKGVDVGSITQTVYSIKKGSSGYEFFVKDVKSKS